MSQPNTRVAMRALVGTQIAATVYGPLGPRSTSCEHNHPKRFVGVAKRVERSGARWGVSLESGLIVYAKEIECAALVAGKEGT